MVICFRCRSIHCQCHHVERPPSGRLPNMHFTYLSDVYCIEFARHRPIVRSWKEGYEVDIRTTYPSTTVKLLRLDPTEFGAKNAEVVAVATVGCYHKDRYLPEVGRKQAIRLLCSKQNAFNGKVPKEMRPLIWDAYFNRTRDTDLPQPQAETQEDAQQAAAQ